MNTIEQQIIESIKVYNPKQIAIFGTLNEDEEIGKRINILVIYTRKITLFEVVKIENELSEKINTKVRLLFKSAVNKYPANKLLETYVGKKLKVIYSIKSNEN